MTSTAPDQRTRQDRCPGILVLHEAADGWLARVRVPGGRLASVALLALAALSEELGNGLVDLTARANVQLRGLAPNAADVLAPRLEVAGLLPSQAHDRVRNVLASPLAGRAPDALDDVDDVVTLLDAQVIDGHRLRDLPRRFCFLVDDGSGAGREVGPDVTIAARGGGRFGVALDGRPVEFEGDARTAVGVAVGAAEAFVALRGDAWRLSETPGGPAKIAAILGMTLAPVTRAARTRGFGPGLIEQRDGRFALTALAPLGQLWPSLLRVLAATGGDVRVSTRRTVTLVDLEPGAVGTTREVLAAAELVMDPASGWVGLTACAGTAGCRRALGDVRAAATLRAQVRAATDPPEHWAACERRCGEISGTPVAVAVRDAGDVEVRFDARTSHVPSLQAASRVLAEAF
ncbi:MAG: precorrin-3B synthase [Actinobacteria bacterium]|nr:precorrin-3B synthase [Actinomycetota bacterium]